MEMDGFTYRTGVSTYTSTYSFIVCLCMLAFGRLISSLTSSPVNRTNYGVPALASYYILLHTLLTIACVRIQRSGHGYYYFHYLLFLYSPSVIILVLLL